MFRFLGLLMCGGLLTAGLWLNGQTRAQDPVRTDANPFERYQQSPPPSAGPTAPPVATSPDVNRLKVQDQLRQARLKLQQGNPQEALRLAELAARMSQQWKVTFAPGEPTPAALVAEIRQQAPQVAATRPAIPATVPETEEGRKAYVKTVLEAAREEIAAGQYDKARGLILQARQVDVTYGVFDLRPEHVLAELARHQPARPEGPSEELTQLASGTAPAFPATTSAKHEATAPASAADADKKQQAVDLVAAARRAMAQGHMTEARELALQARQADVTWGLFEDRPDHLIADLERQTNTRILAANPPANKVAAPSMEQNREQALNLLKEARELLGTGNLDAAQERTLQAQTLDVAYGLFDDRPDLVQQEIRTAQTRRMLDQPTVATAPPSAAPNAADADQRKAEAVRALQQARNAMRNGDLAAADQHLTLAQSLNVTYGLFEDRPETARQDLDRLVAAKSSMKPNVVARASAQDAGSREDLKTQALTLLADSRAALNAGNLEAARAKAEQAATFDVAYDLFEDNPERMLSEIDRAAGRQARGSQPPVAMAQAPQADPEILKNEALSLLASARQDLQAGRLDQARVKVDEASTYDVTYGLFEESPERLRSEIVRAGQTQTAKTPENALNSGSRVAAEPDVAQPLFGDAPAVAAAPRMSVDQPLDLTEPKTPRPTPSFSQSVPAAGGSALEMYNQGIEFLRNGDRTAAYEAFLQAYNSGDTLDAYRRQQLQDKLRELAPRRRSIQQASNETVSLDSGSAPGQTGRLDQTVQERAARFDRLRTECLNAIFRAEKMRDKKPDEAVALLNQTLSAVQASELSKEEADALTASLTSARTSIEGYMAQKAPLIELERKNTETRGVIEREISTRVRVEQEIAALVDEFNDLMDQKRFAEAHAKALQAKELDGNNPVVVTMELKSTFAMRNERNEKLRSDKETSFWEQLQDVEESVVNPLANGSSIAYPSNWEDLKKSRKKRPADSREHTEMELRVRSSLSYPVSLHFDNTPLAEVMQFIANTQGINVVVDPAGLADEGIVSTTPVTIAVDGIRLSSALNLMLHPLNLDYTIANESLIITSRLRQQGDLETRVYQVADLVVPVNLAPPSAVAQPYGTPNMSTGLPSVPVANPSGFPQIPANPIGGANSTIPGLATSRNSLGGPSPSNFDFNALHELITTTVSPDSWDEVSGAGTINRHESTLSLVVRQTQKVHQEIEDLLDQLRRLQDLQITIEVRIITVSDDFFEQIGIDFDFNVNDSIGGPVVDNNFDPIRPFGSTDPTNGALGGARQQAGGQGGGQGGGVQGGQQGQQAAGGSPTAPFGGQPNLNIIGRDNWPSSTVVGLTNGTNQFSADLDIPFRQGSFDIAAPSFGGFDPNAGIQFGMAILSDIEAFMFVRAAQGDRRSNVMFAPKITLFNGMIGTVFSGTVRPFVISLIPVASAFNIGFQPVVQPFQEGTQLTVQAVVSADRRYVRLAVNPQFTNITDVFTFSFISGGGGGGGIGGGGIGGGGGGLGGGGQQGQQGRNQQGGSAGGSVTVQLPVQDVTTVQTVVSVPDGGTVLLGGVKSLREQRNMAGVPILNKIPYISRLFKNTGVGRETQSVMLMVTPRIIIQEEEEQLLGIPN